METDDDNPEEAYETGVRLLARREHASRELAQKLARRGFSGDVVNDVVDRLFREGYLSDDRFTEAFVRQRCEQGQGPLKIIAALAERGIDEALARQYLDRQDVDWIEQARLARSRRFGENLPADRREWARQARFLASRGFSSEQVYRVLDARTDE
ncbi:regulatory protein RecX [Aquisalimonas lutea]|uniref:regulatory protein RecX n=1 Tax=Aquisalimonas lutea TaxID=1327750 RepID=UPI0025B3BB8B|nr:regulatory protein RecX [Aquisalimonas lutea]MDN3517967.1 regulatory protein RecX [Aquisalimonas lutea]